MPFLGVISMNFSRKLFVVTLSVLSLVGLSQLNAMQSVTVPSLSGFSELKSVQDHKVTPFQIYMNMQLIENCPTLPLDVINVISFNAYISNISDLSQKLTTLRNNPKEVVTLIKRLQDSHRFNLSVHALKTGLAQASMSLNDIEDTMFNGKLLDFMYDDENNLDTIKIIFAVAGDQVHALLSAQDGFSGMSPFHHAARQGCTKIIRIMLDVCGDKAQDLIDHRNVFGHTALDLAKLGRMVLAEICVINDPWEFGRISKLNEVIKLLESYQWINQ